MPCNTTALTIVTLSTTTPNNTTLSITVGTWVNYKYFAIIIVHMQIVFMVNVMMLSVIMLSVLVESHYTQCHYAQCQYAQCQYAQNYECCRTECCYAECCYALCSFVENRGASQRLLNVTLNNTVKATNMSSYLGLAF
jgi:hypothetical protein